MLLRKFYPMITNVSLYGSFLPLSKYPQSRISGSTYLIDILLDDPLQSGQSASISWSGKLVDTLNVGIRLDDGTPGYIRLYNSRMDNDIKVDINPGGTITNNGRPGDTLLGNSPEDN